MKYLKTISAIFIATILLFSCSKNEDPTDPTTIDDNTSTITSFSPTSGQEGVEVTIEGTNFSTTISDNAVAFNGTTATITSATETSIVTTVPIGATTGKLTITINDEPTTSADIFTVEVATTPAPTITSIAPIQGKANTLVTITGSNFGSTVNDNTVMFNGVQATITEASATELKVTVPENTSTGKIKVTTNNLNVTSNTDFTIIEDVNLTFYGTMQFGGDNNAGTVYKIETSPASLTIIKQLSSAETGSRPNDYMDKLSDGKYYSSTRSTNGTIFRIDPSNDTFEKVTNLPVDAVGNTAISNLIEYNGLSYFIGQDRSNSNLTQVAVYSLNTSTKATNKFYTFNSNDANSVNSSVLIYNDKLYSQSFHGTTHGSAGAVLSVDLAATNNQGRVISFTSLFASKSLIQPTGAIVEKDGVIYGSTLQGGDNGRGLLYKYDVANDDLSVLDHLDSQFNGGVRLWEAQNKLFSSSFSDINVYDLTTDTSSIIATVTDVTNHSFDSPLVEGSDGNIYGFYRIYNGTQFRQTVFFKYDTTLDTLENIYTFNVDDSEGWLPGSLIEVN